MTNRILHTAEIEMIHELVHVGIRRQVEQKIVVDDSLRACADVFAARRCASKQYLQRQNTAGQPSAAAVQDIETAFCTSQSRIDFSI